ncbi:MAG: ethanolamine ammonia-lyase subunit EutB [Myxococcales bacterium]|nr:ethanolamine ammonia-lyase subunit EutB [Myxococcales bacterium]
MAISGDAGDDLFAYIERSRGGFDRELYRRLLAAAGEWKEGDAVQGLAADDATRALARRLLGATRLHALDAHPPVTDRLHAFLEADLDRDAQARTAALTLHELADFLLTAAHADIQAVLPGLSSHVLACLVKLLDEPRLVALGARIFNVIPGTDHGAPGRLGARLQPNSPTDHPDDIRWQVFDGWAYGVGDLLLGTNPVSSDPRSLARVESALHDIRVTFGLQDTLPHCVLAHIDAQAAVEASQPGTTGIWFQSIAGDDATNACFDLTLDKLCRHCGARGGRWGLYFETGQGSEVTNGHGRGLDLVALEARKYGLARALQRRVAAVQRAAGHSVWCHVNDVAGFIGPEVFRSPDQLVRVCLEDLVLGKLHGLVMGLDVCATMHMDITPDDLDRCLDRIVPACPAYLMALPTKHDPMLSYLTTGFHDHVRLRRKFARRVDGRMGAFFRDTLRVLDERGEPGPNFGDPRRVYLAYCRARGDDRSEPDILAEAAAHIAAVRARGVPLVEGHGPQPADLPAAMRDEIRLLHSDARRSLHAAFDPEFLAGVPDAVVLRTCSRDRDDYILHPAGGETLHADAVATLGALTDDIDVQLVISDGLNALALTDPGHLAPFLAGVRPALAARGLRVAREHLVVRDGRVRAGYHVGRLRFADLPPGRPRLLVHLIGERPGTVHHNYSIYLTAAESPIWARGAVDHDITRVISGVSDTALHPDVAVRAAIEIAEALLQR